MNSNITIATKDLEKSVEKICKSYGSYTKRYYNDTAYFELENVAWDEEYCEHTRNVADFLSRMDETDYAFVRVGDEVNSVQINGSPSNFNMKISVGVSY